MFKQSMIALASAVALGTAFAGSAEAVDFKFQFNNVLNGEGVVEGFIRGLEDNGTSAATSVEVTSNTEGFGIGEYVGNPLFNSWTVTGGILTDFDFISFGSLNTSPAVTDSALFFGSRESQDATFRAGLNDASNSITIAAGETFIPPNFSIITIGATRFSTEDIGLTFTRVEEVESVPEPASLLSLFAIGAVAAGGALKKKAA
jgi:hypothetical protein